MLKMFVVLEGQIGGLSIKDYTKSDKGLGFGGYCFQIPINGNVMNIPFDFQGFAANVQDDGTLLLEAGADTFFGHNGELDDCYDQEYEKLGITRDDLTAKVLASVMQIEEFVIDVDVEHDLKIRTIEFFDETGVYPVNPDVVMAFSLT